MTRNVVLRSADSANLERRGYTLFTGRTSVDLYGVLFENLGRTTTAESNDTQFDAAGIATRVGTNPRGRYAVHMHHVESPFRADALSIFVDPAIPLVDDLRWGFTHHNGHGELIDSVCVGELGACLASERGSETGAWRGNLVIGTGGGYLPEPGHTHERGQDDLGSNGFNIWMRGPMIAFDDNIVAGVFGTGISYDIPLTAPKVYVSVPWIDTISGDDDYFKDIRNEIELAGTVQIHTVRNRSFKKNIVTGTALREGLLALWYARTTESERYRIEASVFELTSRSSITEASTGINLFYTSAEITGTTVSATASFDSDEAKRLISRGICTNDNDDIRLRVNESTIEGFTIDLCASARGGDFFALTLRNEINIVVEERAARFPSRLDEEKEVSQIGSATSLIRQDAPLPWTQLVHIKDVHFYPPESPLELTSHVRVRLRRDIESDIKDLRFFGFLQPSLTMIENSTFRGDDSMTTIERKYVYDPVQHPDCAPFTKEHLIHFVAGHDGSVRSIVGVPNHRLWEAFRIARGGVMMPVASGTDIDVDYVDCTYRPQSQWAGDSFYGIDGYVHDDPP